MNPHIVRISINVEVFLGVDIIILEIFIGAAIDLNSTRLSKKGAGHLSILA
ncbi:MAG: hypothetical protein ACJAT2_001982 [Bacteriovoracaceae bacterium]|jgi:hypothetical protein